MSLIQCDEKCKYQQEGFCRLEKIGTVNTLNASCPYYRPKYLNQSNGVLKASDPTQL